MRLVSRAYSILARRFAQRPRCVVCLGPHRWVGGTGGAAVAAVDGFASAPPALPGAAWRGAWRCMTDAGQAHHRRPPRAPAPPPCPLVAAAGARSGPAGGAARCGRRRVPAPCPRWRFTATPRAATSCAGLCASPFAIRALCTVDVTLADFVHWSLRLYWHTLRVTSTAWRCPPVAANAFPAPQIRRGETPERWRRRVLLPRCRRRPRCVGAELPVAAAAEAGVFSWSLTRHSYTWGLCA